MSHKSVLGIHGMCGFSMSQTFSLLLFRDNFVLKFVTNTLKCLGATVGDCDELSGAVFPEFKRCLVQRHAAQCFSKQTARTLSTDKNTGD